MPNPAPPWYREPMVLMVIAGPLIVMVASFITLALALRYPDPPLRVPTSTQADRVTAQPAVIGRNHAATGGQR